MAHTLIVSIMAIVLNGITLSPLFLLLYLFLHKSGGKMRLKLFIKFSISFLVIYHIIAMCHSNWVVNNGLKKAIGKIDWSYLEVVDNKDIDNLHFNNGYGPRFYDIFNDHFHSKDEFQALIRNILADEHIPIVNVRSAFRAFINENSLSSTDTYKCDEEYCYSDMYALFSYTNRVAMFNWFINMKHAMCVHVMKDKHSKNRSIGLTYYATR
mgnify:CR=1 FL=1